MFLILNLNLLRAGLIRVKLGDELENCMYEWLVMLFGLHNTTIVQSIHESNGPMPSTFYILASLLWFTLMIFCHPISKASIQTCLAISKSHNNNNNNLSLHKEM
jgi:hypothetical protein